MKNAAEQSRREGPMRRKSRSAALRAGGLLAIAALAPFAAPAHAEVKLVDLVGHSLKVSWTNTALIERDDGSKVTGQSVTNMTLYVGAQKHVFERIVRERARCPGKCRGGPLSDTHESVVGIGELGPKKQWTFEQGALVRMLQMPSGARRLVIDFGGAGDALTCSIAVHDLRENGEGPIISRSISGETIKILSRSISGEACEVVQGNLIAGDN